MTFTYSPFDTDKDRVRFHIGDTDEAAARFTDETINAIISEAGSWQQAVIDCLEGLIALLSQPNFSADWLSVDNKSARAGYETILALKRQKFGLQSSRTLTVGTTHVYRADSNATEEPDYAAYAQQQADDYDD